MSLRARRALAAGAAAVLGLPLSGCLLFSRPEKQYVTQERVLEATALAAGYLPDPSSYALIDAEVSRDSITFQYRGVRHPGDRAWMIRFAQKSTEQKPLDLVDLERLVDALRAGKDGFEVVDRAENTLNDLTLRFFRYRYLSPIQDDKGNRVTAGGAAGVLKVPSEPAPVIYQLNVENLEGDRPDIGWAELEPLVRAVPR
jgi:hypothetical protein